MKWIFFNQSKKYKDLFVKNRTVLIVALISLQAFTLSAVFSTRATVNVLPKTLAFFPSVLDVDEFGTGTIFFQDIPAGVSQVRFNVIDGIYAQKSVETFVSGPSGRIPFALKCTTFSQVITLQVQPIDATGQAQTPGLLMFRCGIPPIYNFSQALHQSFPILKKLKVHFFILEDQITTLSSGAFRVDEKAFKRPSQEVERAIRTRIVSALSAIWDQCSIGFEAGEVRVIDPYRLQLSLGNFGQLLFAEQDPTRIVVEAGTNGILKQAIDEISLTFEEEGVELKSQDLIVFFVGRSCYPNKCWPHWLTNSAITSGSITRMRIALKI